MTLEAKSFSCFNQYNLGTGDLRFDSLQLFDYAEARDDQAVVQSIGIELKYFLRDDILPSCVQRLLCKLDIITGIIGEPASKGP